MLKMDDIARLANVSKSAVSLALNERPGVSDATRRKILSIAEHYNYVPLRQKKNPSPNNKNSGLVRFIAIKSKSSETITEKSHEFSFLSDLLAALSEKAKSCHDSLIFDTLDVNADFYKALMQLEKERPSDGIILLGSTLTQNHFSIAKAVHPHLVVVDASCPSLPIDFVSVDNYQGGYAAAEFILTKGHSRIGYAAANTRNYNYLKRQEGFFAALAKHEIGISKSNIYSISSLPSGQQTIDLESFLKADSRPTAIFCENDYIAINLQKALQERGINIPDDIAIMGFDDIHESTFVSPELTTVHFPIQLIAEQALNRLDSQMDSKDNVPQKIFIGAVIVERKSL